MFDSIYFMPQKRSDTNTFHHCSEVTSKLSVAFHYKYISPRKYSKRRLLLELKSAWRGL
jgi:hypothetical protein